MQTLDLMSEEALRCFVDTLEFYHKKIISRKACKEEVLALTADISKSYDHFSCMDTFITCSFEEAQQVTANLLKKKEENQHLQKGLNLKKEQLQQENIDYKQKRADIKEFLEPYVEKKLGVKRRKKEKETIDIDEEEDNETPLGN